VPRPPLKLGDTPRCGDHVAVPAEQRLDRGQDGRVRDGLCAAERFSIS
jgi:hypothetical protein